ncbi:hypothetical protein Bpfe_008869 [Biomphalaria pfeifferi]|uniref:Uncharacterized protein n=1 Tax=Biomphalaria pfeifferi TaxID=112525 RepID=A0AAD8FE04_BIOPF|nr:hypothetical protein Bpfe_008869 [Biomphalaria pfeifferi]
MPSRPLVSSISGHLLPPFYGPLRSPFSGPLLYHSIGLLLSSFSGPLAVTILRIFAAAYSAIVLKILEYDFDKMFSMKFSL